MAMSIDTRDQIDWNSQILQEISYFAEIILFLSTNSKVEKLPYSSWDGLHTGTQGDLPHETKLTEVNEPGFFLTEFPE